MDAVEFAVRDASLWETREDEPMGTKRKVWLEDPDGVPCLFKYVRQDSRGGTYGDDRAEKLAAELARLIGVPAADVDLARRHGDAGVLCRRINDPDRVDLVHGNELLGGREPKYDRDLKREHPLYTVEAVYGCLAGTQAPPGVRSTEQLSGFAVWARYLVFDAWTANTEEARTFVSAVLDANRRRLLDACDRPA